MRKIVLAMLAAGFVAQGAEAQSGDDQEALVRDLRSDDSERVVRALNLLPIVISDRDEGCNDGEVFREGYEVTTELVEALIIALKREVRIREEGRSPAPYLEMNYRVMRAVAATGHPLTVDILLRAEALWGGIDLVLCFGPDAVLPRAVELAGSPEATPREAWGALGVLENAVERWDESLGPEIREAMKEVAILFLEGPPDSFASAREANETWRGFLFDGAVALAKVLRDPELTAIVRKARHPSSGRPGIPL